MEAIRVTCTLERGEESYNQIWTEKAENSELRPHVEVSAHFATLWATSYAYHLKVLASLFLQKLATLRF